MATWTIEAIGVLVEDAEHEIAVREEAKAAAIRRDLYRVALCAIADRSPEIGREALRALDDVTGERSEFHLFERSFSKNTTTAPIFKLWARAALNSIPPLNAALETETVDHAIVRIAVHRGAQGTMPARILAVSRALRRDLKDEAVALLDVKITLARDLPAGDRSLAARVIAFLPTSDDLKRRYAMEELAELLGGRARFDAVMRDMRDGGELNDEHKRELMLMTLLRTLPARDAVAALERERAKIQSAAH